MVKRKIWKCKKKWTRHPLVPSLCEYFRRTSPKNQHDFLIQIKSPYDRPLPATNGLQERYDLADSSRENTAFSNRHDFSVRARKVAAAAT
jgi:hypothetical protein